MVIALITDFGLTDHYVGVVKGVVYSQGYNGQIVDICHAVTPYSIEHAQFILVTSYTYFPEKTIFIIVVDPGVGTQRNILMVYDGKYFFLMPDNGIVGCLTHCSIKVWAVNTDEFVNASNTFHGRDIFAVLAARLALHGLDAIKRVEKSNYVINPFPYWEIKQRAILTKVAHVDRFGNCILSLPNERYSLQLRTFGAGNQRYILNHCTTYAELHAGAIGILPGSSGFIEICMNQNDCSKHVAVTIGDVVELHYE